MSQITGNIDREWLKILGKGMVTLPKKWRQELGIETGDIVRARKEGNKVVIETQQVSTAPYRVYTDTQIEAFLKEDILPKDLLEKSRKKLSAKAR